MPIMFTLYQFRKSVYCNIYIVIYCDTVLNKIKILELLIRQYSLNVENSVEFFFSFKWAIDRFCTSIHGNGEVSLTIYSHAMQILLCS